MDQRRGLLLLLAASANGFHPADFFIKSISVYEMMLIASKAAAEGDTEAAILILAPLARKECAEAYYALGTIFEVNADSKESLDKAITFYRKAYELGYEPCAVLLARLESRYI